MSRLASSSESGREASLHDTDSYTQQESVMLNRNLASRKVGERIYIHVPCQQRPASLPSSPYKDIPSVSEQEQDSVIDVTEQIQRELDARIRKMEDDSLLDGEESSFVGIGNEQVGERNTMDQGNSDDDDPDPGQWVPYFEAPNFPGVTLGPQLNLFHYPEAAKIVKDWEERTKARAILRVKKMCASSAGPAPREMTPGLQNESVVADTADPHLEASRNHSLEPSTQSSDASTSINYNTTYNLTTTQLSGPELQYHQELYSTGRTSAAPDDTMSLEELKKIMKYLPGLGGGGSSSSGGNKKGKESKPTDNAPPNWATASGASTRILYIGHPISVTQTQSRAYSPTRGGFSSNRDNVGARSGPSTGTVPPVCANNRNTTSSNKNKGPTGSCDDDITYFALGNLNAGVTRVSLARDMPGLKEALLAANPSISIVPRANGNGAETERQDAFGAGAFRKGLQNSQLFPGEIMRVEGRDGVVYYTSMEAIHAIQKGGGVRLFGATRNQSDDIEEGSVNEPKNEDTRDPSDDMDEGRGRRLEHEDTVVNYHPASKKPEPKQAHTKIPEQQNLDAKKSSAIAKFKKNFWNAISVKQEQKQAPKPVPRKVDNTVNAYPFPDPPVNEFANSELKVLSPVVSRRLRTSTDLGPPGLNHGIDRRDPDFVHPPNSENYTFTPRLPPPSETAFVYAKDPEEKNPEARDKDELGIRRAISELLREDKVQDIPVMIPLARAQLAQQRMITEEHKANEVKNARKGKGKAVSWEDRPAERRSNSSPWANYHAERGANFVVKTPTRGQGNDNDEGKSPPDEATARKDQQAKKAANIFREVNYNQPANYDPQMAYPSRGTSPTESVTDLTAPGELVHRFNNIPSVCIGRTGQPRAPTPEEFSYSEGPTLPNSPTSSTEQLTIVTSTEGTTPDATPPWRNPFVGVPDHQLPAWMRGPLPVKK